jgi:hypothetical protein
VSSTVILIMFAESMIIFFSNLKSINGNGTFFSIVINRNNDTMDAAEKVIICIKLFEPLSGHWIPEEQPQFVIEQLAKFFSE